MCKVVTTIKNDFIYYMYIYASISYKKTTGILNINNVNLYIQDEYAKLIVNGWQPTIEIGRQREH